ncbi:MAG: hypothetical protein ACOX7H_03740 [Bacillota bacterium]|jgi:hypothetical protein
MPDNIGDSKHNKKGDNKEKIRIRPVVMPLGRMYRTTTSQDMDMLNGLKAKEISTKKTLTEEELKDHIINEVLPRLQPEPPQKKHYSTPINPSEQSMIDAMKHAALTTQQAVASATQAPAAQTTVTQHTPETQPDQQKASHLLNGLNRFKDQTRRFIEDFASENNTKATEMPEISLKKWMLIILLSLIPILNIIMAIFWIKNNKINPIQKTYAKALLLWIIIIIIAIMLLSAVMMISIWATMP